MNVTFRAALVAAPLSICCSIAMATVPGQSDPCPAQLYDLGDYTMPITTTSSVAQQYFDQGLIWAYSFHHSAAERAFKKAAALDPSCAMCFWGQALVRGPNINAPMTDDDVGPAYDAVQKAIAALDDETPRERAYVSAIAKRYAAASVADRKPFDQAYSDAMNAVAAAYPDDVDAATLYAESLMDMSPWNYWTRDGQPLAFTNQVVVQLEKVMTAAPDHPGANHYYVHLMEAHFPQRAEAAADRLATLVPDAGHMVHMPSHIYLRVGRYSDAAAGNQAAIDADLRYRERCQVSSFYTMMYVPHNYDFLIAAAGFQGQSALALKTAQDLTNLVAPHLAHAASMVDIQQFWMTRILVMVRFGKWDDILRYPEPSRDYLYARGLWRYARALAFIRTGGMVDAAAELDDLELIAKDPSLGRLLVMGLNTADHVLKIGVAEGRGELLAAKGDFDGAIQLLKEAVRLQDELVYIEPPSWYHSSRLALGAVLLDAGRAVEAEKVFEEDLVTFPGNPWALRGLKQSLDLQGRTVAAGDVHMRLTAALQNADVDIPSPRF